MFARGVVSLHTARLSVPKALTSNPRVSITYKLIQTKDFNSIISVTYEKQGGGGSHIPSPP
jgi:hypothetical protein